MEILSLDIPESVLLAFAISAFFLAILLASVICIALFPERFFPSGEDDFGIVGAQNLGVPRMLDLTCMYSCCPCGDCSPRYYLRKLVPSNVPGFRRLLHYIMGRHKRIQSKKRNTLKSVDPFNTAVDANKEKLEKKQNAAPSVSQLDEQTVPKNWIDVNAWKDSDKFKKPTKKRTNLSLVEKESKKMGIEKRPFETQRRFLQRVNAITYKQMHEEKDKAKFGVAGRDRNEIAEETKQLDEDLKRKKEVRKEQVKRLMANRKGAKEQRIAEKKAERKAEVESRKAELERQKRAALHKERRQLAKLNKPKKENPHLADRESVIELYRQMKKQKPT